MERDFMGIGGKGCMVKEHPRGVLCNDSVFLATPRMMSTTPQQFTSLKVGQEDRLKLNVFDQFPSSGYQPMSSVASSDATQRHSSMLLSQKIYGNSGQGTHPFLVPMYPSRGTNSLGMTALNSCLNMPSDATNHSIPMTPANNFLKGHGSTSILNSAATCSKQQPSFGGWSRVSTPAVGSKRGGFAPSSRNPITSVPATAQLTIFYGGAINVYDNIPIEKAEEIMFLASACSSMNSITANPRKKAPPMATGRAVEVVESMNVENIQPQTNAASPRSGFSSPISIASNSAAQSGTGSSSSDELKGWNTTGTGPSTPRSQNEPFDTVVPATEPDAAPTLMSRAVPMARKASLARFLEKRKERVTSVAPYSTKKPIECAKGIDMAVFSGKSTSAPEASLRGGREQSRCLGTPKYTDDDNPSSGKLGIRQHPPNTKLKS